MKDEDRRYGDAPVTKSYALEAVSVALERALAFARVAEVSARFADDLRDMIADLAEIKIKENS